MWNFAKLDTTPPNSPLSPFSASCHPQTVKYHNENPLSCHPFPPKLLSTCENIGLQSHLGPRNSQALPNHTSDTPPMHPQPLPGDPQPQPQPHPSRSQATPSHTSIHPQTHPSLRTHTPSSPQIRMQFPNRSDSATRSDTNQQHTQGELHAKLLGGTRVAPPGGHRGAWPGIKPTISTPGPTGVEGAGGSGGHGRASRRGAERSEAA